MLQHQIVVVFLEVKIDRQWGLRRNQGVTDNAVHGNEQGAGDQMDFVGLWYGRNQADVMGLEVEQVHQIHGSQELFLQGDQFFVTVDQAITVNSRQVIDLLFSGIRIMVNGQDQILQAIVQQIGVNFTFKRISFFLIPA